MIGGTEGVKKMQVSSASQLPDNVLGLDGVDVVVWEADKVKVSDFGAPEFQLRALLHWVKAGDWHYSYPTRSGQRNYARGRYHRCITPAGRRRFFPTRDSSSGAKTDWCAST